MPRSALIVAVPEAEPLVHEWRLRYDNASLGIPAHITLIFPFVPREEIDDALTAELREIFGAQPAFDFSLPSVARFPEHAWLAPDPSDAFTRLIDLLAERYPDYPPYEGEFEVVTPHLTVAEGDETLQNEVAEALSPHLPVASRAHEVTLLVEDESGQWTVGERFPLGG